MQGGIGTAAEDDFLLRYYLLDGTGWATPFLLVPEVTNVDRNQLEKLLRPARRRLPERQLAVGRSLLEPAHVGERGGPPPAQRSPASPEAPAPRAMRQFNTEFTEAPICTASRTYITRKLEHLAEENLTEEQLAFTRQSVLAKSCICHDLAGGVTLNYDIDPTATPAICCGPNIVNFSKIATLEEMVGHIYGRLCLLANSERPNMFVQELRLYVEHLHQEIKRFSIGLSRRPQGYFATFKENLLAGVDYYRGLAKQFIDDQRGRFLEELESLQAEIERVLVPVAAPSPKK